jgi:hypothetical protein
MLRIKSEKQGKALLIIALAVAGLTAQAALIGVARVSPPEINRNGP